jgi:hypothetical protein
MSIIPPSALLIKDMRIPILLAFSFVKAEVIWQFDLHKNVNAAESFSTNLKVNIASWI